MKIPADAQIDDRKLYDYLLVPLAHDDKSGYLTQAGFDRSSAESLRSAMLALCASTDAIPGDVTKHGSKWLVSGIITGPNGRALAVTLVWMQRVEDGRFHFVTLVPRTGGRP